MAEQLMDREGDVWDRQPDGLLKLAVTRFHGAEGLVLSQSEVESSYGPLATMGAVGEPTKRLRDRDGDTLADFIRELRELCDRWATRLGA